MIGISAPAAVYGVVDPAFARKCAVAVVMPEDGFNWTPVERMRILALQDLLSEKINDEVSRIEGQLTLMLAHEQGQAEHKYAKLEMKKVWVPFVIGTLVGAAIAVASMLKL